MLLTFLISLQKRLDRSPRSRMTHHASWLWLALALFSCSIPARAQSTYVICNSYLEADVSASEGLVTIYYAPCNAHVNGIVHSSRTSYLTVLINSDSFYTNNQNIVAHDSSNNPPYTPAGILNNGTTRYTGPNKDTIETVWEPQGPNTYKIIQDIYLAAFPIVGSGQVIYRFSVENLQNATFSAQAQYLLDIDVGDKDAAPITTRYDFLSTQPLSYPNTNTPSIPSYFIATQQAINSATFPGLLAEGFCSDSLAPEPMGLMEPLLFAYVQWPDVAPTLTWGAPTNTQTVNDDALLFQWPPGGSNNGQTNEIGSFSYGTAACSDQICFGNLDAIMLHPEHIVWDGTSYSPNPFPVEGIVWNQNNQTAITASGTQTITNANTGVSNGPIKIISPLPTTNNGYTQNHSLSNGATILGQNSSSISWLDQVLTNVLDSCSTYMTYNIAFSVAAGGVGSTSCQNAIYTCPIEVDCQLKDVTPPGFTPFVCVAHDTTHCGYCRVYTDTVFDNRSGDEGVQSISWVVTPNPGAVIVDTGTHSPCSSAKIPITVTQIDTLQAPCVYFTFTDCANNISRDTICFDKCLPPGIVDTLPPRFRLMDHYNQNLDIPSDSANFPCEFQCSKTEVTDSVEEPPPGLQRDGGLKSITVVSQNNMSFTLSSPVTLGMKEDTFSVCVIDSMLDGSIVIGATDSIGNVAVNDTITYCTVADTLPPVLAVDPLSGGWLVTLSEKRPWDRGVDSVLLTDVENCWPVLNASLFTIDSINDSTCSIHPVAHCPDSLYFSIAITDTFMNACFTIDASDCPANTVSGGRICKQALADTFCPTDTVTQLSPTEIMVIFSDYHQGINYDVGLDSITLTNVHNMSMTYHTGTVSPLPNTYVIHEPDNGPTPAIYPILDTVFLYVTNPTLQDTAPAKVCWTAIDGSKANNGGGNYLCTPDDCFSYVLSVDTTPPDVTINYDPCDTMAVTITDTRPMDRGIYNVWLDTSAQTVNLLPFSEIDPGASSLSFILPIIDPDKSASGHLTAFDLYGDSSLIQAIRNQHTTTLDFAVYRENMAMKASGIVNTPTSVTFNVPVYLDSTTDTFALGRKNITQFQFTFQITGSNLLSFIGTQPASPTMHGVTGWNITSVPGALPRSYTITGQTTGAALTDAQATDTIAYLTFNGQKSPDVEEAQIVIDSDDCGDYVIYNGGTPTTLSQPNVTITTPPPAGLMTGGSVIFMDSCATIIGNNPHPTILSIAPAIPNPFTGSTLVQYTVPTEANVTLDLYNALGQKVRTLLNDDEKQGTYQITLDAQELPAAYYFLRLQANGQVCSQQVVINK